MSGRAPRVAGLLLAIATLGLVVAGGVAQWVGSVFPGFLVLENRVVASIALPDWDGDVARLFQREIVAVDGMAVRTGDEVYAVVAGGTAGSVHAYEVRGRGRFPEIVRVPARVFGTKDFALLYGAYLLNAVAFLGVGLIVLRLKPRSPTSHGFVAFCLCATLWLLTACDLYGPYRLFRLHVVAEALLTATGIHLALVFPTDRLCRGRASRLVALYVPFVALAAVYEMVLGRPAAYTVVHLVASAAHGLGAVGLLGTVAWGFARSGSPLVRSRVGVVVVGLLAGFIVPAVLMAWSAFTGGRVPLNAGAFTSFLFPLALGYAIVKHDLFEIDVVLRRAVTYVLVVITLGAGYLVAFYALHAVAPVHAGVSPLFLAAQNLAMLLLLAPLKTRIQRGVDRVFFRGGYDPERALSNLALELASAHGEAQVACATAAALAETMGATSTRLLLARDTAWVDAQDGASCVPIPSDVATSLASGRVLTRWAWDEPDEGALPEVWGRLDAELLVPVLKEHALIAVLALGRRGSGQPYRLLERDFLAAAAGQVALALTTAAAFGQLAALNADLEAQVHQRTAALEVANAEVHRSLAELRAAYAQLELSQASLLRADRLATLGRLAAGIAHEVNTPLGATLAELKLLADAAVEYRESIRDPAVSQADHDEIAAEIQRSVGLATEWTRKAAAYIRRMKVHGRDTSGGKRPFPVRDVIADAEALLAHRLRAAACRVDFAEEPVGIVLHGDPAQLGQVVVNVLGNALDAYEDAGRPADCIEVRARRVGSRVQLAIRDWAGGMPPEVAARVFDELYTTKDAGRGTGLGLWITRTLVEESFAGTIALETEPGVGSCFTIDVPIGGGEDASAAPPADPPGALAAAR